MLEGNDLSMMCTIYDHVIFDLCSCKLFGVKSVWGIVLMGYWKLNWFLLGRNTLSVCLLIGFVELTFLVSVATWLENADMLAFIDNASGAILCGGITSNNTLLALP